MANFFITPTNFGTKELFGGVELTGLHDCRYDVDDRVYSLFKTFSETDAEYDGNVCGLVADCMTDYPPVFTDEIHERAWWYLRDYMRETFNSQFSNKGLPIWIRPSMD